MRFRNLAVFPLVYAAVFIVAAWWLMDSEALSPFVRGQLLLIRLLAITGCLAAVSAFERGDHLRHAWLWLAVASILVLVRDVLRLPPFELPGSGEGGAGWIVSGLGVLSNVALLIGVLQLARAWKKADIPMPGGRTGGTAVAVIAAVVALAVAGPGVLKHGESVLWGDWSALVLLASAVVDILSLCLLAPLLMTAVALRGGLFAWPWALITASILSWLFYDAAAYYVASGQFPLTDVFRGLALNYLFVAGLAQRLAVQQVRRAAE